MRILIHGLQSSGASLFAFFLSQAEQRIGIIDLYCWIVAPCLQDVTQDVILKCIISPEVPLCQHAQQFRPDVRILFRRDPESVIASLSQKSYRDFCGTMEEKLTLASKLDQKDYDLVIDYETFISDRDSTLHCLGPLAQRSWYGFPRTAQDILEFNARHSAWCRENFTREYGFGGIHFGFDDRPEVAR